MCIITAKLPRGISEDGTPKKHVQGEGYYQDAIALLPLLERHPLSVGKHRNRATKDVNTIQY